MHFKIYFFILFTSDRSFDRFFSFSRFLHKWEIQPDTILMKQYSHLLLY